MLSKFTRHVTSHHKDSTGTGCLMAMNNSMHWLPRASLTPHVHAVGPNYSACEVECWQGTHNQSVHTLVITQHLTCGNQHTSSPQPNHCFCSHCPRHPVVAAAASHSSQLRCCWYL
jgi:hypothetical protein